MPARRSSVAALMGALVSALCLAPAPASAQTEARIEVSARAESLRYEADGSERYLALGASTTAEGTTLALDSYRSGWVTCADGSLVWSFELTAGSGPGRLAVSGRLAAATVDGVLTISTEQLSGCPETSGPPVSREVRVTLTLTATGRVIKTVNSLWVRVPAEQNQRETAHATIRAAEGSIGVGEELLPATTATIERWKTWSRGGASAAAPTTFGLTPLSWLLGSVVQNDRRTVIQALAAWTQTDPDWPTPGSGRRYLGVVAETVDKTATTVYAAVQEDTVITCGDGLAIRSTMRFGSGAGSLAVGPRFSTATARATVPVTERRIDECTGGDVSRQLAPAQAGLDLRADSPVITIRVLDAFAAAPDTRRRDVTTAVGRADPSGTLFFGTLTRTPTEGGINEQKTHSHSANRGS